MYADADAFADVFQHQPTLLTWLCNVTSVAVKKE